MLLNLGALGGITWRLKDPAAGAVRIELPPTLAVPTLAPHATPTQVRVLVHVAGAVVRSGVVSLNEGARVADAVDAAGGFSETADQRRLNLAASITDGAMLWVPALGEDTPPGSVTVGADAAPAAPLDARQSSVPGAPAAVNVNTATAVELEALPGIGPSLAARIVAYRETQGPFGTAEQLLQVPGIGPRTLERFADLVRVR
jgi:competence protein ComEA